MSVCLCDTNKKEVDFHINDCLRNQGMAIFDPDTEEDQRDYDGYQLAPSMLKVREDHLSLLSLIVIFLAFLLIRVGTRRMFDHQGILVP